MTQLRWGSATDVGLVRDHNEDQLLVASPLFAVADGMGGAKGGEVASLTAVEVLKASFGKEGTADELVEAVRQANRAVFEKAGDPKLRGMGTTITALALLDGGEGSNDDELAVVNVGDSRSYLLRDGELQQLTDDHNVPGELLRRGELSAEEAATHPQRNLVTRVLGVEDDVEVDVWQLVPYAGDRYLLASDGLFGEVDDGEIATVLRTEADPDAAASKLVQMARDGGGHDNITVVIVDVVDDGGRAEAASEALAAAPPPRTSLKSETASDTDTVPAVQPDDELLADDDRSTATGSADEPAGPSVGRILLFLLAGMILGAAAFAGATWYGTSTWYLAPAGDELLIHRGRPGGFLWIEPEIVESTGLELDRLPPEERGVADDPQLFDSLGAARDEVDRLERRAEAYAADLKAAEAPPPTTTTAPPPPPPAPAPSPAP